MWNGSLRSVLSPWIFVIALAGVATPAAAQFEPSEPAWGGVYMGLQGGYGWGKTSIAEDPANPVPYNGAGNGWSYDSDGMLGGAHIGVDWESYALILGIELSGGYLAVEGKASDPGSPNGDTVALGGRGYYGEITGRIGFAPDRTLFYAKGGPAFADLGLEVNDTCSVPPCSTQTVTATDEGIRDGWTAGFGVGYAFPNGLAARFEYAYYDFGDIAVIGSSAGNSYSWKHEVQFHAVTVGMSFIF